jgi:hypothetical protein
MNPADRVIQALEDADRASTAALSTFEKISGFLGRNSARWHRWRAFRLRLRASRIEAGKRRRGLTAHERALTVALLRNDASEHMMAAHYADHGMRWQPSRSTAKHPTMPPEPDLADMRALQQGREPLAGRPT